jgi:hypothetical protein
MTIWKPGTVVFVGQERDIEAVIVSVKLSGSECKPLYEVCWYDGATHNDQWLEDCEFSAKGSKRQSIGFAA